MFGSVLVDDASAIESLKKVDKKGESTNKKLSDMANKGLAIGTAVVAGAGVAIGGLMSLANSTADTADKWDKLSLRTGIAVENLQRWGYAAEQSGADITVLETGIKKMSDTMIDAQNGTEASQKAYEALGISMTDLSTMTPEQTFDAVMNSLADMEDGALKNSIGNDLLGKSFVELKPLLAAGSDGMDDLKGRADELGLVLSEDAVASGVKFGDTLADAKSSLDGVKNGIMVELMPKLTEMLEWFLSKMPAIKEVAADVFDKISVAINFITDNINIILPILGLFFVAMMAMKVMSIITGLTAAWSAVTTIATGIQTAFNLVMAANPIALVILAIVALIAIGVLLWKNWDKIKEAASAVFDKLKNIVGGAIDKIKGFFQKVIDFVKDNWQGLLLLILNPFAGAFKLAYDNCEGFRNKVNEIFDKIKSGISDKVNAIKTTITKVFSLIKDIMANPFEAAKTAISLVIDKIKGFLNFKWEFPKLKMPHFSISGSMNPLKWVDEGLPKIGVSWYKNGGIFDKPTIFNTPYGLKGVGDASSPEVVAPLDNLKEMLGLNNPNNDMTELIQAIKELASRPIITQVDSREIARSTAPAMSKELASLNKIGSRKVGIA